MSLRQTPRLHLVELSPGALGWFLRLPDLRGGVGWRAVPLPAPAAWARASGFPALALAIERLVGTVSSPTVDPQTAEAHRGPG